MPAIQGRREAEEFQAEVKAVLKKTHTPALTSPRKNKKTMKQLRNDNTRVILITDKQMSTVVMDRDE